MSLVAQTTSSRTTATERRWCTCTLTTVWGRIKIAQLYTTCHGELAPITILVSLSYLVVSHTKFAPDWCFGLFKRQLRRINVGNLRGIAQVVNNSVESNVSQLLCDENGHTIVPTYDWTDFFAPHLENVTGIKKYHHFCFTSSEPGVVYARVHTDTDEVRMDLNKSSPPWSPNKDELPPVVDPKSLSAERQWYLKSLDYRVHPRHFASRALPGWWAHRRRHRRVPSKPSDRLTVLMRKRSNSLAHFLCARVDLNA